MLRPYETEARTRVPSSQSVWPARSILAWSTRVAPPDSGTRSPTTSAKDLPGSRAGSRSRLPVFELRMTGPGASPGATVDRSSRARARSPCRRVPRARRRRRCRPRRPRPPGPARPGRWTPAGSRTATAPRAAGLRPPAATRLNSVGTAHRRTLRKTATGGESTAFPRDGPAPPPSDGLGHRPGPQAVPRVVGVEVVTGEIPVRVCPEGGAGLAGDVDVGGLRRPGGEVADVVVEEAPPPAGHGPERLREPGRRTHVGDPQQHDAADGRGQPGDHLLVVMPEPVPRGEVRGVVGTDADEDNGRADRRHLGKLGVEHVGDGVARHRQHRHTDRPPDERGRLLREDPREGRGSDAGGRRVAEPDHRVDGRPRWPGRGAVRPGRAGRRADPAAGDLHLDEEEGHGGDGQRGRGERPPPDCPHVEAARRTASAHRPSGIWRGSRPYATAWSTGERDRQSSAIWMLAGNTATKSTAATAAPSRRDRGRATATAQASSARPLPTVHARGDPGSSRGTIAS